MRVAPADDIDGALCRRLVVMQIRVCRLTRQNYLFVLRFNDCWTALRLKVVLNGVQLSSVEAMFASSVEAIP